MKVSVPYLYEAMVIELNCDAEAKLMRGSLDVEVPESRLEDMPLVLRYEWRKSRRGEGEMVEMRLLGGRLYGPHMREDDLNELANLHDSIRDIHVEEILWTNEAAARRAAEETASRMLAVDGKVWLESKPPRIVVRNGSSGEKNPLYIQAHDDMRVFGISNHVFALDEVDLIPVVCGGEFEDAALNRLPDFQIVRPDLFEDVEASNAAALALADSLYAIFKKRIDDVEPQDIAPMVGLRCAIRDNNEKSAAEPDLGSLVETLEGAMAFARPRMEPEDIVVADQVITRCRHVVERRRDSASAPGIG